MNNLYNIFSPINTIFFVIIFVLAYFELQKHKNFKSIIVSVGVLGTFVGIFIGLLDFDTTNLKNSITNILEGLKTAFVTSIAGMGTAIALSIIEQLRPENKENNEDSLKELIVLLKETNFNKDNYDEKIINELERLRLVNSDIKEEFQKFKTTSLNNQINLENLLKENFTDLQNSLALAIEHLSKGATEEIIKALQKVIEDFNQELQNQFGENFIKLNEAVINLLKWQENYKSSIETTEIALQQVLSNIQITQQNFENAVKYQEELNNLYQKLEEIIKTYHFEIEELNRHLFTYKELSDKAKEYLENIDKVNDKFNELTQTIQSNSDKQLETINSFIENSTKEFINNLSKAQQEINLIIQHFKQIEQEIPNALQISLENLNKGLASLTQKFRQDYEEIINNYKNNLKR